MLLQIIGMIIGAAVFIKCILPSIGLLFATFCDPIMAVYNWLAEKIEAKKKPMIKTPDRRPKGLL